MSWVRKFQNAAQEFGFAKAVLYIVNRGLGPVGGAIHLYHFLAQPVPEQRLLAGTRGQSITVREISGSDPVLLQMPLERRVIDYRLSQQATCLGAFKGETMIGCIWLCLGPYQEDEVRCRFQPLPEGQASWDFDFYLFPDQRRGLAFARLWDEANTYLYARGVRWSMSRISTLNLRSLASHSRLGTQQLGKALFVHLGGMQIAVSSIKPHLHISFASAQFPQYALQSPGN